MFTSILAATDFSDSSFNGVLRAARIARHADAQLHIVHVAPASAMDLRSLLTNAPADLQQRLLADAHARLDALGEMVRREYDVNPSLKMVEGALLDELDKAQKNTGADLTVLGARGASVARHLLLGSTAERLLAQARHPILVVRSPGEVPYRRTLIPVDFSDASMVAVRRARAIAPSTRVTALHAYEAPFEGKLRIAGVDSKSIRGYLQAAEASATEQMFNFVQSASDPHLIHSLVLHGHPLVHVLDQEEELGCQLIVVGGGSGSRAQDFLLGSLSRRVLSQSRVDVLLSV